MDYERIDFKTGQVLTADALNHMQDGIEAAIKRDDVTLAAYADLVSLRNEGKLKAGKFYRITDYMTTTAQFGTLSAGHPFDVIVLALSKDALAEEAYAVHSERDTEGYFANSNLSAWKIWYSLDNDTAKFAWADAENGKGVIYRMIDEFNNDIPYDFKNILYSLDDAIVECEIQKYGSWFKGSFTRDSSNDKVINNEQYYAWFYKVTAGPSGSGICYTKEERISVDSILYNDSGSEFSDVKLLSVISEVYTFGRGKSADLSVNCHNNSIGVYITNSRQELNRITFGDYCRSNTFGNGCYSNTFGNSCNSNIFGENCNSNIFGENCSNNIFGDYGYNNTFGDFCRNNTFGNSCSINIFGGNCDANTFGNGCYSNTFGNSCDNNSFGNDCYKNSFRESASENASIINYCQHNHFDDGCVYNVIWSTINPSSANPLRNININRGVRGKLDAYNYINIETLNSDHEINVNQIDGIVSVGEILSIRHASLKSLRDNGQLIAGQQYRIIDYVATTSQANTQSAGHQFDLIVTADDNKTLNEKARAIQHEGDTYFANSDLNAWEVWYCLDNDSERFAWGGEPETRTAKISAPNGVEATFNYANVVSHIVCDSKVTELKKGERVQILAGPPVYMTLSDDGKSIFLEDPTRYTPSHPITVHFKSSGVIYRMIDEFGNDCPYDFKNIQFKRKITDGSLDVENGVETYCYTFNAYCVDSGAIEDASVIALKIAIDDDYNRCYGNIIKSYSPLGVTSSELNDIVFLNIYEIDNVYVNCQSNIFGNDCQKNTFGNNCRSNTLGNNCRSNTLGGNCISNSFGNDCSGNTFGNNCNDNSFGNGCSDNTFGNRCEKVTFNYDGEHARCSYCVIHSNVKNVVIECTDFGDITSIRYIHVYSGIEKTTLEVGADRNYVTTFAKNSSGNVVEFCLADLKNS